jgi:hypothetical protein
MPEASFLSTTSAEIIDFKIAREQATASLSARTERIAQRISDRQQSFDKWARMSQRRQRAMAKLAAQVERNVEHALRMIEGGHLGAADIDLKLALKAVEAASKRPRRR